jgi:transcriptional regulator with GAF, ATPase, and Fis domain
VEFGKSQSSSTGSPTAQAMGVDERQHDALVRRLEAVQEIADLAIESLALDELLGELLGRLKRILRADTVTILLREGDDLVVRASKGLQAAGMVVYGAINAQLCVHGQMIGVASVVRTSDAARPYTDIDREVRRSPRASRSSAARSRCSTARDTRATRSPAAASTQVPPSSRSRSGPRCS